MTDGFMFLCERGWRRVQDYRAIGIVSTFFGVLRLGGSHAEKRGDHQKKEFCINNSVEALILFNEEDRGLLKLQISLGWEWRELVRGKGWGYLQDRTMERVFVGGLLWLGGNSW